jgi:hypothetical protein
MYEICRIAKDCPNTSKSVEVQGRPYLVPKIHEVQKKVPAATSALALCNHNHNRTHTKWGENER